MKNEVRNERIRFAIALGVYGTIVVVALIFDSYLTYIGR
jgi:hypothetical protein